MQNTASGNNTNNNSNNNDNNKEGNNNNYMWQNLPSCLTILCAVLSSAKKVYRFINEFMLLSIIAYEFGKVCASLCPK